ncbi:MAG: RtcB family protein [Candidatus Poribacteria bacterium]|nr:RtcB family protein [Candidatus Poribacteria bacterium]
MAKDIRLEKIDAYRWRIPKSYMSGMRVDGIIYANEKLLAQAKSEEALQQVANVAHLPGIVKHSLAMPDLHWGYGFVIGGVAATDPHADGVVSPGGIGYDINCGVRLVRTNLTSEQLEGKTKDLVASLFEKVPCGVGSTGKIRLTSAEEKRMIEAGSRWAIEHEYGLPEDLQFTEAHGFLPRANADAASKRALERGKNQLGTLGSGNHFLEVQVVDRVLYREAAEVMGLTEGQICIMIHTGSRGFGYQVCDEHVKTWVKVAKKYGIDLPDRQLAAAPINSPEGQEYITAMACGANYAWNNRQCITHWVRQAFMDFFDTSKDELGLELVYDVAHNIGKFEKHRVDGVERELFVHRKGATRAFPAGHPEIPDKYQKIGQPVFIPGSMGTASYVLVGNPLAMEQTWGTTCHGAGRMLSRRRAIQATKGRQIDKDLEKQGIFVRAKGRRTLHEEVPEAYKDVDEVVKVVDAAGLSRRVARLRPIGVVKG